MDKFRQKTAVMVLMLLIFFGGIATSQAAIQSPSATMTLDWNTFKMQLYEGFPGPTLISEPLISEDCDSVYGNHGFTYNSNWGYDWLGINTTIGSASAMTTPSAVTSQIYLDTADYVSSAAVRSGSVNPESGLLMISVDYFWNVEGFFADPKYINVHAEISAHFGNNNFSSSFNRFFNHYTGSISESGSGNLTLLLMVDGSTPIHFSANSNVNSSLPVPIPPPLPTPVPGSVFMLFSGLAGLTIFKRHQPNNR